MIHPQNAKAAGGNHAAILNAERDNTSKNLSQQAPSTRVIIEVTVISDNPLAPSDKFEKSGAVARTLVHLKNNLDKGLTRAEALERWGILSLSQHVHELRHEHGLEIDCERVPYAGRDGFTKFGRYHLISKISIRVIKGSVK